MKKRIRDYMKLMIVLYFCLAMFGSAPKIVPGYIDRMNPAIILLEILDEEIIVDVEKMPEGSAEGKWVDVIINKHGEYEVVRVDEGFTAQKEAKMMKLQKKLLHHSLRDAP